MSTRSVRRSVRRHAGVVAMCIVVSAVFVALGAIGERENNRRSTPAPRASVRAESLVVSKTPSAGRIYPYSVIPGGVRSRQELANAIARDPVVAAHYRSVSLGAVRAETVTEDRFAYMSYRIGNTLYWTRNKVRLKKGETILTDGLTQVRARCGNCISMQPMTPTSDDQPDTVEFEALTAPGANPQPPAPPESTGIGGGTIVPTELVSGPEELFGLGPFASADAGPVGIEPAPESPFTPPTTNTLPPVLVLEVPPVIDDLQPPPADTAPVPEPGTLLLVTGGLATMLSRRRGSHKH